jgi:hypothetical protein
MCHFITAFSLGILTLLREGKLLLAELIQNATLVKSAGLQLPEKLTGNSKLMGKEIK